MVSPFTLHIYRALLLTLEQDLELAGLLTPIDIRISQMLSSGEFKGTQPLPPAPIPAPPTRVPIDETLATPVQVALAVANAPGGKWFVVCQGREPGVYAAW